MSKTHHGLPAVVPPFTPLPAPGQPEPDEGDAPFEMAFFPYLPDGSYNQMSLLGPMGF